MELRYWLVHGNVKNNRINKLNEKHSLITKHLSEGLRSIVRVGLFYKTKTLLISRQLVSAGV